MESCRVFLLDDHKIIRDGIKSILQHSGAYKIIGEEGDPLTFINQLSRLDVDILLLDISFPQISGLQILAKVRKQRPEIKVMILSMHNDPEFMQRCASLGALGYLTKDSDAQEFLKALDLVRSGQTYFQAVTTTQKTGEKPDILSDRELEVLMFISNGFSSKQIAAELSISARTVETHRLNIMKKLGTTNSAETISVAAKLNLI